MGRKVDGPAPAAERASVEAGKAPGRSASVPDGSHALLRLQSAAGNRATVAMLGYLQPALEVGGADDPLEREADAVARQVVAALRSGPPATSPDDEARHSSNPPALARLMQRQSAPMGSEIGAAGGAVDASSEAQIENLARSGGSPIATSQRHALEQAFGGADFGDVRLHSGPGSSELNRRFGARAFTVGRDIFFQGEVPSASSGPGAELLAHELTHTIQQSPARARRRVVHRDFVDAWDDVLKKLSADARLGYDQFLILSGQGMTDRLKQGCFIKDGTNANKYDTARAEGIFSKKKMSTDDFDKALAAKKDKESGDVQAVMKKINHLCNETDGTHRPGSVGDGTSEWALKWEAANGEPFRSPSGHYLKIRDYCKVLKEGLDEISAKRGSVAPTAKMQWKENNAAGEVEVEVLTQLGLVVTRATDRLAKMRVGLVEWNDRISKYSAKWNTDGTSAVKPPGVDPLAKGQLKAGWPGEKTVTVY